MQTQHIGSKNLTCLGENLLDFFRSDEDCDIMIAVGKKQQKFRAHKCILKARSKFFRALFASNMRETQDGIFLPTITAELFPQLLEYIYSGHSKFNNCVEAYIAAEYLGIEPLCLELINVLCFLVCVPTVFTLLEFSIVHTIPVLKSRCEQFIIKTGIILHKTQEFIEAINKQTLQFMIENRLTIGLSMDQTIEMINFWCQLHDSDKDCLASLLKLCSPESL